MNTDDEEAVKGRVEARRKKRKGDGLYPPEVRKHLCDRPEERMPTRPLIMGLSWTEYLRG